MSARLPAAAAVVAALSLGVPRPAAAQVTIETNVSARRVEVGQSFQFQIVAMSAGSGETPRDPLLTAPPGITVRGPSIGTQTQVSISGGRMLHNTGISATWTLTPERAGTFRIGPGSVDVGRRRQQGQVVTVEVVAPGTLPRPRARPFDPFGFDPFGGGSPFQQLPFSLEPEPEEPPAVPEELRLERAPDPIAFLRAVVTPERPVVGEQVTLRIYAYGSRGRFAERNTNEPSRADFLGYGIVESSYGEDAVRVPIGSREFIAVKVRELALFPLRAGSLTLGPMTMTFHGPGYRFSSPVVRQSERIVLEVDEPPRNGRPAGYKLGDVGEFELTARVDPTRIVAGDAVSVVARLEGTGNLPHSLIVPQRQGIEWAEPSLVSEVDAKSGSVRGFRVFTYVVKLLEPGNVELGELTLPYFDPKQRRYAVARAELGSVRVDPNPNAAAKPVASASAAGARSALDAAPRKTLAAWAPASAPFTDDLRFWALLLAAPVTVALTGAGFEVGKRVRERLRARRTDPDRLAAEALREAGVAANTGRAAETASAVERALFRAIEAGTGLKARALLRSELGPALTGAGVPEPTAATTLALLDACETLRFTEATSGEPPAALVDRARPVVAELARKRRRAG